MRHIYLINKGENRSSQYGIGTYIREIVRCISDCEGLRLTWVWLETKVNEFTVEQVESGRVRILKFPVAGTGRFQEEKRLSRNIAYMLTLHTDARECNIFHFNHQNNMYLVDEIRRLLPACKMVTTIHYLDWCFGLKGNTERFHSILNRKGESSSFEKNVYTIFKFEQKFFEKMDAVFCLSRYIREVLVEDYRLPADKLILVYNGIRNEYRQLNGREWLDKRLFYGFTRSQKILLFVGRLDEGKGVEFLIEAFRRILNRMPEAHLLIAGDGDYDTCLKASADIWSRITYTGKVGKETLYDFYRIADIGGMPSFLEQCSYVAIEMMMHGLPIVGTDSTGLSEMLLPECRVGFIRDRGEEYVIDTEALSNKILDLLNDPIKRQLIGKIYRDRFHEKYIYADMMDRIKKCYENL